MKTILFVCAFIAFSVSTFGQNHVSSWKVDDVFIIHKKSNTPFKHLYFPKTNFIMKRGSTATYKSLDGMRVKIVEMFEDGTAKLSPINDERFFNQFYSVDADLEAAIKGKELKPADAKDH